MKTLQRYGVYKDSGLDWLGEVPAHWEAKRVKDVMLSLDYKRIPLSGEIPRFTAIYQDAQLRDDPENYLDYEAQLTAYIDAHPNRSADAKAKAAQYFTILNRIEYVIALEDKYRDPAFLQFWRQFNALYNQRHRSTEIIDPIEVYFDNQIGIVEVTVTENPPKHKTQPQVADGAAPGFGSKFDIMAIIVARNAHEAETGKLIAEFESKIMDFFHYVRESSDGQRLIVKINSNIAEAEIYADFAKLYRRYKALHRKQVGDYFFKETQDLVEKLCDDFEGMVRDGR